MEVYLSHDNIVSLFNFSDTLLKSSILPLGGDFSYGLSKNMDKLRSEAKAIGNHQKNEESYQAWATERDEKSKELALKDDNGNPQPDIIEGGYLYPDEGIARAALMAIDEKHKEALEKSKEFMEEEKLVNLHAIRKSCIPKEIRLPTKDKNPEGGNVTGMVYLLMSKIIVNDEEDVCVHCGKLPFEKVEEIESEEVNKVKEARKK